MKPTFILLLASVPLMASVPGGTAFAADAPSVNESASNGLHNTQKNATSTYRHEGRFFASYAALPLNERISKAGVIFHGQITAISGTLWNQDSGEYWEQTLKRDTVEAGLPYQELSISVITPVSGEESLGRDFSLFVLGLSSKDKEHATGPSFEVGQEVFVLAHKTEIAWRSGKRLAWSLIGAPRDSCLVRREDGLFYLANSDEGPFALAELAEKTRGLRTRSTSAPLPPPADVWRTDQLPFSENTSSQN